MAALVCKEAYAAPVTVGSGKNKRSYMRVFTVGQIVDSKEAGVNPAFFDTPDDMVAPVVETATAAPGEKRTTTRKKSTKKEEG